MVNWDSAVRPSGGAVPHRCAGFLSICAWYSRCVRHRPQLPVTEQPPVSRAAHAEGIILLGTTDVAQTLYATNAFWYSRGAMA